MTAPLWLVMVPSDRVMALLRLVMTAKLEISAINIHRLKMFEKVGIQTSGVPQVQSPGSCPRIPALHVQTTGERQIPLLYRLLYFI